MKEEKEKRFLMDLIYDRGYSIDNEALTSISLSGQTSRIKSLAQNKIIDIMKKIAREISIELNL